ncbi:MAG: DEAD/DEAH box helicase family protein [Microthrixaceae bacterium]|nr:DEAD/DEAH box helicase family protein [Microthrixaceae bacterium]
MADTLDSAEPGAEIVCDLATATGKTYIAAGVIDYLAAAGTHNVLIVCPGTTILTKTVANFTPGNAVAGLDVRPTVITAGDCAWFELGGHCDRRATSIFVFLLRSLFGQAAKICAGGTG